MKLRSYLTQVKEIPYFDCYLSESGSSYQYGIEEPHDKLFKDLLNDTQEFISFVNGFIDEELAKEMDENEMVKCNQEFISNRYSRINADVVYKIKDKAIYFLVEHQSSMDPKMPYRMLNYTIEIMRNEISHKKRPNNQYEYPKIIPIVLYTGERKWNVETQFEKKMANLETYAEPFLRFKYLVVDIHNYKEEDLLKKDSIVAYGMLLEESIKKEGLEKVIKKIAKHCMGKEKRKDTIQRILRYIYFPILGDEEKVDEMMKLFQNKEVKENMKTAQDYIRQQMADRKKEGKKEGIREGIKDCVTHMIRSGLASSEIAKYTGISKKEVEKISKELNCLIG